MLAGEPEPTRKPAPEREAAPGPTPAATPELEPALSQSLELEPAPAPEPPWPSPVAAENGLREERPHLLAFPPDLVAEQFTLMDAVSSLLRGRAGGRSVLRLRLPTRAFPGPELVPWPHPHPQLQHCKPGDPGKLLVPKASISLPTVERGPHPTPSAQSN